MPDQIPSETYYTHSVLGYLNASLQGRFAALNILSQLNFEGLNTQDIKDTQAIVKEVNEWLEGFWRGTNLFTTDPYGTKGEAGDKALQYLEMLRPELHAVAMRVLEILEEMQIKSRPEEVKYLIAALGRYTYSRDNYIRGYIRYGETYELPHIVENYNSHLEEASLDVERTHTFLKYYKENPEPEHEFFAHLTDECVRLPTNFLTHIHDINQLIAPMQGGMNFEFIGVEKDEAAVWEKLKITPGVAGYWRAYGIDAEEAETWIKVGLEDHKLVSEWRLHGFPPEEAKKWHENGFSPEESRRLLSENYTLEGALKELEERNKRQE